MLPIMAKSIVRYGPHFDMVKPMLSQFYDKYDINDPNLLTQKTTFGEGVFGIKKSVFFEMNGFEPWICAADSEFNWRVRGNGKTFKHIEQVCFLYRRHSESLTNNNQTNLRSRLRYQYHLITNNKKAKADNIKATGNVDKVERGVDMVNQGQEGDGEGDGQGQDG